MRQGNSDIQISGNPQGTYKKCQQTKCVFLTQNPELCPNCPECVASPHELCSDDSCQNCWCCEGDEGYVREGVPKFLCDLKEKMKNPENKMVIEIKQEEE